MYNRDSSDRKEDALERIGRFCCAEKTNNKEDVLDGMDNNNIAGANELYRAGDFSRALTLYESIARRPGWANIVRANIELCRRRIHVHAEGQRGHVDRAAVLSDAPQIVVTMTTIRSRLLYLPRVIESLAKQTLRPVRIDLNISHQPYLLDEGVASDDPVLAELMTLPLVRVNWVANIGPYRKIWPFLEEHFSRERAEDRLFVTVDDDTIYPEYFLEQLYENYLTHDCVVAFRGRHIEFDREQVGPYETWTWGRCEPTLSNLPTGKDGILYSTKFFTKEFLNLSAALEIAPTADDLWIKWHCALNGFPSIVLNPEACSSDYKSFPVVNYDKSFRGNSLYARHNATGAQSKNDASVERLEAYFACAYGYDLAWLIQSESNASC
ncbi:hypothetical protein OKW30_006421 [Paraburkholderia sp. Clong3]|uniref:glycosyltransferase family A protein n=1 Tax=Paraburkholderia sp. Clong3 TaxID=2991061 RepID=UPI003D1C01F1